MKKKPTKKSQPNSEYDSQRQQNVLLQEIRKQVTTIAEGHSGLDQKIDKANERLDEMGSDMQIIKGKLSEHSGRLAEHSGKLAEHDGRFDRIESAITENSRDIKGLRSGVVQLKAGQERIEQKLDTVTIDHEQRIQKLEVVR